MPSGSPLWGLLAAATLLVALIDGGSVVLTEMSVPDDTTAAGQAGAQAVEELPATRQNVVIAFEAARAAAAGDSLKVRTKDFRLFPNGEVSLTASRTAPTLVFHRLPWFRDLTVVTSTATVSTLPFD